MKKKKCIVLKTYRSYQVFSLPSYRSSIAGLAFLGYYSCTMPFIRQIYGATEA